MLLFHHRPQIKKEIMLGLAFTVEAGTETEILSLIRAKEEAQAAFSAGT
jgi:hypothetical protein